MPTSSMPPPTLLKDLGLEKCSSARTPRVKRTAESEGLRLQSPPLTGSAVTLFRSGVMRCSYLDQDRPNIAEAVRVLASSMATPLTGYLTELKRLARYLAGRQRAVLQWNVRWHLSSAKFEDRLKGATAFHSDHGNSLHVYSDADWAGDPTTRKSASGFVACLNGGLLRSASTTQTAIGFSSCESEFYGLCRAAASGIGLQSNLADLDIACDLIVWSDASAARSAASRRGPGKVFHLHTRFLGIQGAVASRALSLRCIWGTDNPADAFTKALIREAPDAHCSRVGLIHL